MTKPFDMGEFLARCKALVRRTYDRPDPVVRVGELSVDTSSRSRDPARAVGSSLRAMEYRLLEYLMLRAGQIVSKAEILEHLYDFNAESFSNVIEVHISALRRKLDSGLRPRSLIHTDPRPGICDRGDVGMKPLSIRLQLSLMVSLLTLLIITVLSDRGLHRIRGVPAGQHRHDDAIHGRGHPSAEL